MWRFTLVTICTVYVPLILVNLAYVTQVPWGNQLNMQLIENIILSVLMIVVTIVEHKMMVKNQDKDAARRQKKKE